LAGGTRPPFEDGGGNSTNGQTVEDRRNSDKDHGALKKLGCRINNREGVEKDPVECPKALQEVFSCFFLHRQDKRWL